MEKTQKRTEVLSKDAVHRKMKRLALQVAENNIGEEELFLAGVEGNGETIAGLLRTYLLEILSIPIQVLTIRINKKNPVDATIQGEKDLSNKVVIVVDDVANTGRTMLYAFKPFLHLNPKKIQTLVLVERSHKLFPVQTDYAGLSISTTLQEHIAVEEANGEVQGAWLF